MIVTVGEIKSSAMVNILQKETSYLFHQKSQPTNYTYDTNGNTITEGSTQTSYNLLNLPSLVTLVGGRKIENTYVADGRKLATVAKEGNELKEGTKTYNGNLVFDLNGDLEYVLFSEGRILHDAGSFTYEYHLKDHLGSTRVAFAPTSSGANVVQINIFYPFGAPIAALSWSSQMQNKNRYKHTGMETIEDFGLGYVDNFARWRLCPYAPGFGGLDIFSEKYPHLSPYLYAANNPMRNIDPDGRDWYSYQEEYKDKNGDEQTRTRYMYYKGRMSGQQMQEGGYTHVGETISALKNDGTYDNYYQNIHINDVYAYNYKEALLSSGAAGFYIYNTNSPLDEYAKNDLQAASMNRGQENFLNHPATQMAIILTTLPSTVEGVVSLSRLAGNLLAKLVAKRGSKVAVQFGKTSNQVSHAFRHTDALGLDRSLVQSTVQNHFSSVSSQVVTGQPFNQVVQIGSHRIQYTAWKLADGTFNIGRMHAIP